MVNMQDVARRAQVGATTVLRVLSGKGYVSEETRKKVLAVVEELDYVPNELARNLLHHKTSTIAVVVPDVSNAFFANFVNGVETVLRHYGYRTMLCNSFGQESNEAAYLNMLSRSMVDGIITASSLLDNSNYAKIDRPIVSLDNCMAPQIPMVCADHVSGGRAAAELLIRASCRHVLQFRDSIDLALKDPKRRKSANVSLEDFPYTKRHREFQRLIQEAGIRCDEYVLPWGTFGLDAFHCCTEEGFFRFPDVDGVMATDLIALQYARIALEHGKRIPEDLKVVAYDGTDMVWLFYPSISIIVQPIQEIARTAVELLMKRIQGEPIAQNRIILPIQVIDHTNLSGGSSHAQ